MSKEWPLRMSAVACACVLVFACAGCGPGAPIGSGPADTASARGEATGQPDGAAQTLESRMQRLSGLVAAPPFQYEDYELPPDCVVEDYSERWAILEHMTGIEYPPSEFLLLDFSSGQRRPLDWPLVNEARGWHRLTLRAADGWIAWEEISPNEGTDMFNAEWRLYAATFESLTGAVGEPVEIDGGKTSYRLRPHFAVLGDEVMWTRNRVTLSPQETSEFSGRVMARRLPDGAEREICATTDVIFAFRATTEDLVMTTMSEREQAPQKVLAVDRESGDVHVSCTLDQSMQSSHWGDYAEGWLTWSWFPTVDSAWPSLALQGPDGSLWRVDGNAGDGNIINGVLLYERSRTEGPIGRVKTVREICGVRLATKERFVLCESEECSWESCVPSAPGSSYVLTLDNSAYVDSGGLTLVRRYRIE